MVSANEQAKRKRKRARRFASVFVLALLTWGGGSHALHAQEEGNVSQEELNTGARIFLSTCSACHGPDGTQVSGVDLKSGRFRHASTDEQLATVIQNGIPGTGMPPNNVARGNLIALIAYIHAMRNFDTRRVALGDAARGRAVFQGKGGCLNCHRVDGRGSYKALDLSTVGLDFSPSFLQDAILDPASTDLPQNRFVRAVTRSGAVITGRRMNEDTLTVQIVEANGQLVSLTKADLKTYSVEKAPGMPSYKGKLSDAEVADLVAYLASLQGTGSAQAGKGGAQ